MERRLDRLDALAEKTYQGRSTCTAGNRLMPLSERDREELADDIIKDRRISQSMYCGNCGYNLKTLPRSYHCPECGSEYRARPARMKGIYLAHENPPPFGEAIATVVFGLASGVLLVGAWTSKSGGYWATAVIFAAITLTFAGAVVIRTNRFLRTSRLARQIERQQEDED